MSAPDAWRRVASSLLATAVLATAVLAAPWLIAASAAAPAGPLQSGADGFYTSVISSPNPSAIGATFTVTAVECYAITHVPPSGDIVFTDVTTGHKLGKRSLHRTKFRNCTATSIADAESLPAGQYKILASYLPSGADPGTPSHASVLQQVNAT